MNKGHITDFFSSNHNKNDENGELLDSNATTFHNQQSNSEQISSFSYFGNIDIYSMLFFNTEKFTL